MSGGHDRYRIGVDVGGTFTDCVLLRPDGSIILEKTPTTPEDQSDGVLAGIVRLAEAESLADAGALLGQSASIVHGTTAADNTMIQMTGAPTGLLVTEGFRDEIEMRRCYKEDIWDPSYPAPEPIARRRVRLEIAERVTSEGTVDRALDEEGVRKATARLRAFGVTSIAVCFLHSYLNPSHERRAREIILDEYPDVELVSAVPRSVAQATRVRTDVHHAGQRVRRPAHRPLPRPARVAPAGRRVHGGAAPRHQLGRRGHPTGDQDPTTGDHQLGADGRCGGGSGCGRGSGAR